MSRSRSESCKLRVVLLIILNGFLISTAVGFLDFDKILLSKQSSSSSLSQKLKQLTLQQRSQHEEFTKNIRNRGKKKPTAKDRSIGKNGKAGKESEMMAFLGMKVKEPLIILKPQNTTENETGEIECRRTRLMYPFRDPIFFLGNSSVGLKKDPVCNWAMIGTEACLPRLSCHIFQLVDTGNCEESLEITDGHHGYKKYCGSDAPINITAADGLRDLYIIYRTPKVNATDNLEFRFNCTVSCAGHGEGTPLPRTKTPRVNPLCYCGRKQNQDRIINGLNATKGEFPWLVSLVQTNTRQPFCGGAIVNDRIVLTAAHCIKGIFMNYKNLQVVMNGNIMDPLANAFAMTEKPVPKTYKEDVVAELDRGNNSIRYSIEEIIIHPLYVTETNDFDVALLRLPTPVDFSESHHLIPTCLPKLGSYLRTYATVNATISGWGLTEPDGQYTSPVLKKLTVPVIPQKRCKFLYAHRLNRRMLCAGYEEGGRDSCMGDSGGPLVYEEKPQVWTQIGTVSWGEGCATKANPGVYIRTTESGQWVSFHSNANDAVWCKRPPSLN